MSKWHPKWDVALRAETAWHWASAPGSGSSRQLDGAAAKNSRNAERLCPSRSSSSPHLLEQDIPCTGKPKSSPLMGKPQGMWWAPLLPWDGLSVHRILGGWHGRGGHSGSVWVQLGTEDLLCARCFMGIDSLISQSPWESLFSKSGS